MLTVARRVFTRLLTLGSALVAIATVVGSEGEAQNCAIGNILNVSVSFSLFPHDPLPRIFSVYGYRFVADGSGKGPRIGTVGTSAEMGCIFHPQGVTIKLPTEANSAILCLCTFGDEVNVETMNAHGDLLSSPIRINYTNQCRDTLLKGDRIAFIRLSEGNNETLISRISVPICLALD